MREIKEYENKFPLDDRSDDEILAQRRGCVIDIVSLKPLLDEMKQEQKGNLLDVICDYFESDTKPDASDPLVYAAFTIFRPQELSNRAKYVTDCRRQRHRALKGKDKERDDPNEDEEDSHGYPRQAVADDKDKDIDIDINKDIDIDKGIGVATATLIGKPSASFIPMSTEDIQPLIMVDSLSDDVFKTADISKDIVTDIISHFCTAYRENMHKPCPHISEEFAKRIPERIAVLIDPDSGEYLIDEEDWKSSTEFYTEWYQAMIEKYFGTEFSEGCNYSLQHFFSGNIRVLRWYESGRQPYEYE